ncbi:MAG TPA: hypothetical protein VHZ53_07030 [Steroidobacteraceae bacterium]|nr:hypothetical protein [Steroidobacteraceae bacterium]
MPVPDGLHEAIETERGNLSRAESLLGCLAISLEHQADAAEPPYFPDVAALARELVKQSINGLDALMIERRLRKQRVEERVLLGDGCYPQPRTFALMCVGGGSLPH